MSLALAALLGTGHSGRKPCVSPVPLAPEKENKDELRDIKNVPTYNERVQFNSDTALKNIEI